nr:protein aar2 like [Quercus suber]
MKILGTILNLIDKHYSVELACGDLTVVWYGSEHSIRARKDVPQYTLLGIDTQMFSVGPAFKGIKMIPPASRFLYYSSSTRDGKDFSPIIGFFIHAAPSEVIVRRWDQQQERLVKVSEEEIPKLLIFHKVKTSHHL